MEHLVSDKNPSNERESEPHLLAGQCEVYGDIRASYGDLEDDTSLVRFFKEVLDRRDAIDEAEKQAMLTGANSSG